MTIYKSTRTLPYVYRLDNPTTGEFYIGYRCANKEPSDVDFPNYKTSSKSVKTNFDQFNWCIVAEFFDADSAYDFEQQLIFENWNNPLLLNGSCHYKKNRFKCSQHTQETREKLSIVMKGRGGRKKGTPHSEETKQKMSLARKGKSSHWKGKVAHNKGATQELVTCPHCGKSGGVTIMGRWHFDKCKLNVCGAS